MKDDRVYLEYILERIQRIENYTQGDKSVFMDSALVQDAVIRNLQTMTESTQRLSDSLKFAHPSVDWRAIAGFRNILVHDYLGLDLERTWAVIEKRLPSLKADIEKMLSWTKWITAPFRKCLPGSRDEFAGRRTAQIQVQFIDVSTGLRPFNEFPDIIVKFLFGLPFQSFQNCRSEFTDAIRPLEKTNEFLLI